MIFFNVLKKRLKDFHESSSSSSWLWLWLLLLLLRHRTGVFNSTVYRDKVMKDSTRWRCWAGDMSVTSLVKGHGSCHPFWWRIKVDTNI